jgi:anthranilate phosphoribosyltransferase
MKTILSNLYQHKTLSQEESKRILIEIGNGKFNESEIASFLTVFNMRSITINELMGFREGLLELCTKLNLSEFDPMDLCGTGGDGKNTFNISTITSFVVAGAGVSVAKHGNYGVSSISGSSNVLEHLGIQFTTEETKLKEQLKEANICFIHAPLFNPAMKRIGTIRKALGLKTFFNMLGPLVNPSQPKVQMVGVFNQELARIYNYIFQKENVRYSILHSFDGYDEITLTDNCKLITNQGEHILKPADFGFNRISKNSLDGGKTIEDAANLFIKLLDGKGSEEQNAVILANSAMALKTKMPELDLQSAIAIAQDSLFEQKAKKAFTILKEVR